MPADNLTEQLQEHIEELDEHLAVAPKRIEAYYRDEEPPDGFPEYEEPPHQQLIRRGVTAIEFAYEYEQQDPFVDLSMNWGTRDIVFAHVGVGLELLLTGIYMKVDSEDFISKLRKNGGETPNHDTAKRRVMGFLPDSLTDSQRKQISLVIDIVHEQRNNTVHLGLHGFHQQGLMVAYYEVCAYLVAQFSDEPFSLVEEIEAHRNDVRDGIVISGRPPEHPLPLTDDTD